MTRRAVRSAPGAARELAAAGLDDLEALSSRALGTVVTDHRTSWVRRVVLDACTIYIKTYDYASAGGRLRGAFRTTWLVPGRAVREWDALHWLRTHGFGAPEPLLAWTDRRLGFLRRAVLVTRAHPGRSLDALLPELAAGERDELLAALERFVERLHATGFRDGNLDARNLLAQPTEGGWSLAKLDSPRYRLVAAGAADDPLARADWQRLADSLAALRLPRSPGSPSQRLARNPRA
jgi:hypothetical protein